MRTFSPFSTKDRTVRTSKFLSYVLRHNPSALGLDLDPGGWADVDILLKRARAEGRAIDRALLERVIDHGGKTRFTLSEEGTKIRANYGHSIKVNLDLTPTPPPEHLCRGMARQTLPAIQDDRPRPPPFHLRSVAHRPGPPGIPQRSRRLGITRPRFRPPREHH